MISDSAKALLPTLRDLVVHEARLLDEARYKEWLELFTEDAHYWIPLSHNQQDPINEASLVFDDKLLLRMRTERLYNARAPSLRPSSRCLHVLQQATLESIVDNEYTTRCTFSYFEVRGDEQSIYAAEALHRWILVDSVFKIRHKRVNLVNCESALRSIQLLM